MIRDGSLFDQPALQHDFHAIQTANMLFDLGLQPIPQDRSHEIFFTADTLRAPYVGSTNDLLYYAIAKQLPRATKDLIQEDGLPDDRSHIALWRDVQHPEIANGLNAWQDLANDIQIGIVTDDGARPYALIQNESEIDAKVAAIVARMQPFVAAAQGSQADITAHLCQTFDLRPKPAAAFNDHWASRITQSAGFAAFQQQDPGDSWSVDTSAQGWLTKAHAGALAQHGYRFRFSFWQHPIGRTRGQLWIQTDRGPLVLSDPSDAVSLRSHFPVQVSDMSGKPLFNLTASDVPDTQKRSGWQKARDWFRRTP